MASNAVVASLDGSIGPVRYEPFSYSRMTLGLAWTGEGRVAWCTPHLVPAVGESTVDRGGVIGADVRRVIGAVAAASWVRASKSMTSGAEGVSFRALWRGARTYVRLWAWRPDPPATPGWFCLAERDTRPGNDGPDGRPIRHLPEADWGVLGSLSPRELEAMWWSASGASSKQIAASLFRSPKTIQNHIFSLHRKLGIRRQVDLVRLCSELGLTAYTREQWLALSDHATGVDESAG